MTQSPLALVTGASRGIGAAIAESLQPTHRVLLGGRDRDALDKRARELTGAQSWPVDLTDPDAVRRGVADIDELSVLVHSAGVAQLGTVERASARAWRANLEVNVVAVAELTRVLLPALRAANGHVVLINSTSGLTARPGWGPYAASKFALRAFADVLREEERPNGLRVTTVHPGRTDTEMQKTITAGEGKEYDPTRFMRPSSVAEAVRTAVSLAPEAHLTDLVVRP